MNFIGHCKQLSSRERMACEVREQLLSTLKEPPNEAEENRSDSTQTRRDLHSLLSQLFQSRYAQDNRFCFIIPQRFFSHWYLHHCVGDTAFCYLPGNLYNDESWVGLELYVLLKRHPIIKSRFLDFDKTSSILLVDLYAHGSTELPILTISIVIDHRFYGTQFVFYHVSRKCFPEELNRCQGISALFRPATSDLEAEMCGARLLYEQDSELLIQEIIDSTQGKEDDVDLLHRQIQIYLKRETCKHDKVEKGLPHYGFFSNFEREQIEWLQKLLTSTEQVAVEVRASFQCYHKIGFKGLSMLSHSGHCFDRQNYKDEIPEGGSSSDLRSTSNHLHIMAESLIHLRVKLYYTEEMIKKHLLEKLYKNFFLVTLSFKGQIVFDMKRFDSCSTYSLCFPQKEMFKWFKDESCMMELPNDSNWRGIAICTTISAQRLSSDMPVKIWCHLEASEFSLYTVPMFFITKEKLKFLGHGLVWLFYIPGFHLPELKEQSRLVARIYCDSPDLVVKECGIRLLHQQDVEEFKQSIIHWWTSSFDNLDSIYQCVVDKDDEKLSDNVLRKFVEMLIIPLSHCV